MRLRFPLSDRSAVIIVMVVMIAAALLWSKLLAGDHQPAAQVEVLETASLQQKMHRMQENMHEMQREVAELKTTTGRKLRQPLIEAHARRLRENISTMREMGGPLMVGQAITKGAEQDLVGPELTKPHTLAEERMDMRQMMMEQMKLHEELEAASAYE